MSAVQDVKYWTFMMVLEQGAFGGRRRGVHRQVT
jgi:hypothetical protein